MVPQKPPLSMTVTWALPYDPREAGMPDTPFTRSLLEFVEGDDAVRNSIFKLIPRCEVMVFSRDQDINPENLCTGTTQSADSQLYRRSLQGAARLRGDDTRADTSLKPKWREDPVQMSTFLYSRHHSSARK